MNANELNERIQEAEEGDVYAQLLLGFNYLSGVDEIPANDKEAFKWFKAAANQGNPVAQFLLGVFYFLGRGVKQDYNEAFHWYKAAAEQGFGSAESSLGKMYYLGVGVEQNFKEAINLYKAAAEKNIPEAQYDLAICYEKGEGVDQDFKEAYYWYMISYRNGKNDIMEDIERVESFLTKEEQEEMQNKVDDWVKAHPLSCSITDDIISYFKEIDNQLKNEVDELSNISNMIDIMNQDTTKVLYAVGLWCYKDKEYERALEFFNKVADRNVAEAQYYLGICYENGQGLKEDIKEAYYWYLIAYLNDYTDAEQDVKRIENKLTEQQKQEVQHRVNEWFRTHPKE